MSTKKRSSKKVIRVPVKFGDSVHVLPKRNCDRNNDSDENLKHGRGDVKNNNGGKKVIDEAMSMGNKEEFDGDLNGVNFPALSQVTNTPSNVNIVNTVNACKNIVDELNASDRMNKFVVSNNGDSVNDC